MPAYDVAIVGAGPAGSTAAYRLARAGARVLLLDKATFPRDKPCGGGVTGRAARLLPFSIEPVVEDVVDRLECGLRYRARAARLHDAATPARPLPPPAGGRGGRGGEGGRGRRRARARRGDRDRRRRLQRLERPPARPRAGDRARGGARGELPARAALRRRDGARDRGRPRRLRLDLPQGRPPQRRRRGQRGGGAASARRAAAAVRGVRDRPGRCGRAARLPAAAAAAGDDPGPRADGGDRRRGRPRRPLLRRRDVRGVPLGEARRRGGARRAGGPRRDARAVPGRGRAPDRAADPRRLGGEARLRALPARHLRGRPAAGHLPGAREAPARRARRAGRRPWPRAGCGAGGVRAVAGRVGGRYGAWWPMSCIIRNIGRYIETMMIPTISPTPIIINGSMMEVSDWMVLSTSSS